MNKSNFVKNLIFLFALICLWIFPHLFLSSEIDLLKNQEQTLQLSLQAFNDKIERLVERDLKALQDEYRIVKIAEDSLGLVRSLHPFDEVYVDGNRINQIEKIVNEKYD